MCVIFGWRTMKNHTTVRTVGSVALVEQKIFSTVMIVECVLTRHFIQITIAKVESTSQTVLCVKNFCSVHGVHHMKCPVAMPYIGSAFDNWLPMIHGVQFARRLLKQEKG